MKTASRADISAFLAMDVMEAAREAETRGERIARLEVGQPGTPAPRKAREAAAAALHSGEALGYTVALGLPALRERIARMYEEVHGVTVPMERIVITTGSSGAFSLAFMALFETGARLALADPGYPSYRNILKSLGINVVRIEGRLEDGFQPTPAQLQGAREEAPIDGLLVASPANPTGTMLKHEAMQALIKDCAEHKTHFISDEIYDRLWYSEKPTTALALTDDAIIINSFSKYHCMTGWRIGWMVVPEALIRTIERLAQNLFICPPHISQLTALAALDCDDELSAHLETYRTNRSLLLEALPQLGFTDLAPADGAFYVYAGVRQLSNDSEEFSRRMLKEAGVAAVTGLDFDPVRGNETMRFSFAGSKETVELAVERLSAWLK